MTKFNIRDREFSTLSDAVSAAEKDDTITVTQDEYTVGMDDFANEIVYLGSTINNRVACAANTLAGEYLHCKAMAEHDSGWEKHLELCKMRCVLFTARPFSMTRLVELEQAIYARATEGVNNES